MNDIIKQIQELLNAEEKSEKDIDTDRINERLSAMVKRHNNTPCDNNDGLSPEQMHNLIHHPFESGCVVEINKLEKDQYQQVPLLRQALFLITTLSEAELKLTKLGWLPLKIVAEAYHLGQPEYIIEKYNQKRINEYDAPSVRMARDILYLLGWVKTRKGIISLTVKGRKTLNDIDAAANEILLCALTGIGLHTFDLFEDERIGNVGIAYSVWLLNKFGDKWHTGRFYQRHYQKVFDYPDIYNIYETRVFERLFYWLGLVDIRENKAASISLNWEYRKTELLSLIFKFK